MRGLLRNSGFESTLINKVIDPFIISLLFNYIVESPQSAIEKTIFTPSLWIIFFGFIVLPKGGLYVSFRQTKPFLILKRVFLSCFYLFISCMFFSYILKITGDFSRIETGIWMLLSFLILCASNLGTRLMLRFLRTKGGNTRSILFWGNYDDAISLKRELEKNKWMGLVVDNWFYDEEPKRKIDGFATFKGNFSDMRNWLSKNSVDRILFNTNENSKTPVSDLLELFGNTSIPTAYSPNWIKNTMLLSQSSIGNNLYLNIWSEEKVSIRSQIKRLLDLLISIIALIVISPLLLLIACLIKLNSKGPILFTQLRYGLNSKAFKIYKFRTMKFSTIKQEKNLNQAKKNDPRVTSVGKILRKYSLDEFPQLINVIRNEMSLVGPRPHAVEHNEIYRKIIPGYMQRHSIKPGLTGLAQINGFRGETKDISTMIKRIELDLIYKRNWSLWLDFKILIITMAKFSSKNAY